MTDINRLTELDQISVGDLIPIWSGMNGDTRHVSVSALVTFMVNQVAQSMGLVTQYAAPQATDFSVLVAPPVAGSSVFLLITPSADFAAGTIRLPPAPASIDGQTIVVRCTAAVAALVVDGNGAAVDSAVPTATTATTRFTLRFDRIGSKWYCIA